MVNVKAVEIISVENGSGGAQGCDMFYHASVVKNEVLIDRGINLLFTHHS